MTPGSTARDYMCKALVTFSPEMDIHRAIKLLLKHRISGGPVVDAEGRLVGILSKKDCLKVAFSAAYHSEWGGPVAEYMTKDVETIDGTTGIVEVAEMFLHRPYRRFPVMEEGRLIGQISRHDILKALEKLW